jgi:hypothetical protein
MQEFLHGIFKAQDSGKGGVARLTPLEAPCPEAAPSATLKLPLFNDG